MYKWLVWDGRFQLHGCCNQLHVDDTKAKPLALPELCLDPGQGDSDHFFVIDDAIGIQAVDLVERSGDRVIKVRLHNYWHVRCMMLRVYRGPECHPESLVYQEILDRQSIVGLPEANAATRGGLPPEAVMPEWVDESRAGVDTTPFTFRVWVANRPDCFRPHTLDLDQHHGEPEPQPGCLVHDAFCETVGAEQPFYIAPHRADQPKTLQTTWPHRMFLAASAAPDHLRTTLKNAAAHHAPFTDALLRFSKPILQTGDERTGGSL